MIFILQGEFICDQVDVTAGVSNHFQSVGAALFLERGGSVPWVDHGEVIMGSGGGNIGWISQVLSRNVEDGRGHEFVVSVPFVGAVVEGDSGH